MKQSLVFSERLVQRINELTHDLTSEEYEHVHAEIFDCEKERWQRIANKFFIGMGEKKILDVGTGTGFVPLTTANFLGKSDKFTCSEISEGMLSIAKKRIACQNFHCEFEFVKIESKVPFSLPFNNESMDFVTINSVLHHINDTSAFLKEVGRILKVGGLLFIAHEPNEYFIENRFLHTMNALLDFFSQAKLKKTGCSISQKLALDGVLKKTFYLVFPNRKKYAQNYDNTIHRINETLLKENLITKPLLPWEVVRAVEIKELEGFKPDELTEGYKLLHFETYDHLSGFYTRHYKNPLVRWYDSFLGKRYPECGSLFFVVLKKV